MNRAYSVLTVKAVDDEQRIITGVATTPTPDRMGDIIEPLGVRFKNPLPLLHQHRSSEPVGTVKFDKPTKDGITFVATLPKIEEPGPLKDRVDTAWGEVKAGLVRAVSVGFRDIEYSRMENGGLRFIESEVLELSLVTIPANADAVISTIRSIDTQQRAASGRAVEHNPAGVTASRKPVKIAPKDAKTVKKSIAEQISAFEATRQSKSARMDEIMEAAAEKGETLDSAQKEEYDNLESEVKEVDEHLRRLRAAEQRQIEGARVVRGASVEEGSASRSGVSVVSVQRNVGKGIIFTRLLGAKYLAFKHGLSPIEVAKSKFGDTPEVEMILRAPIAALSTTDTTAAAPLVPIANATAEFIDLLRAATIVDRLGLRSVPFNIKVPRATSDPAASWVGEAGVKPVSSMAFDSITMTFAKVAGIVPLTEELMRFSNPAAEGLIRDALVAAIAYLTDRDFLDPTKAEVTGVSPASVTNGVTPITATGTSADALRDDLGSLLSAYLTANMSVAGLKLVMTSAQAMKIALMRNSLGQKEFDMIGMNGGSLEGIPVITSENIVGTGGSPTDGGLIVAINAPEVMLADDGNVDIDVSREASLQMDSSPDSPNTASTVLVSLWQRNMVAIKAERFINWKKRRDGAVQFIQYAKYA